jgi:hypothetical protein
VAVCIERATAIDPEGAKVPAGGSYNSVEASVPAEELDPPAIRTLPSARRVAVHPSRSIPIDPVAEKTRMDAS